MAADQPAGLGERGSAVWSEFKIHATDALSRALLDELARAADRLDELDSIIQGKGVLNLMQFRVLDRERDDTGDLNINVEVKFAAPLEDARKQAASFASLVKTFDSLIDRDAAGSAEPKKSPLDELMQRRKAKGSA